MTFVTTMALLKVADSSIPMTSRTEMRRTMTTAGRFITAPVATRLPCTWINGAVERAVGRLTPNSFRTLEITGPSDGDRGSTKKVFQNQIPSDHPGEEFPHRGIGVGVRAARHGNHGRKLGAIMHPSPKNSSGPRIAMTASLPSFDTTVILTLPVLM